MKKRIMGIVLVALALFLSACSNPSTKEKSDKLQIVATYSVIYDIVKNVGGDLVEVYSLVPIGTDPHQYDPLPQDAVRATDADAIFYNGLNLEEGNGWFQKLMESAGKSGDNAPVFRVSEGVDPLYLRSSEQNGAEDPHAWLDVRNGILYTEKVRAALIKIDPEHKDVYEKNAAAYIQELEALHTEITELMASIPKDKRVLVTSEGAFKYFSKANDFEAAYIWEINAHSQGTPEQLKSIIDIVKTKNVPALFVETSVDPRSMEMVSRETGVPIAGKIFTDSLGKPGEEGDTYMKMLKWNAEMIFNGLGK
ncbi:metal ABC transporter substrate-binding protein [Sporosarcina sp. HYO08]|uniref:metal ABC transporter substrate-binding protein n=1 Tax=Sporosarcina sp. HYO08 TaxID=1759557 RepID=UPI000797EA57|nr:metal ABC transporter substrate-binding protein [Sporosarcina sp. HYO08]KXH87127.1 manganese ABC transporter substrate-binding protein [Sporosarcina sp. HYO08]